MSHVGWGVAAPPDSGKLLFWTKTIFFRAEAKPSAKNDKQNIFSIN